MCRGTTVSLTDVTIHANDIDLTSGFGGMSAGASATVNLSNTVFSANAPVNCGFLPASPPNIVSTVLSTDASCPRRRRDRDGRPGSAAGQRRRDGHLAARRE